MDIITSLSNPLVKELVRLHTVKGRRLAQAFLAEGLRTCSTILSAGLELEQLYVTEKQLSAVQKIFPEEKIQLVSESVALKISQQYASSGIIGCFLMPKNVAQNIEGKALALDGISDPGNMGTIIRSAAAFGYKTIIILGGVDPWSSKVIQSSAGMLAYLTILEWDWPTLIQHRGHYTLCALMPTGGIPPASITTPLEQIIVVIGSEAQGVDERYLEHCPLKMTIPMAAHSESLNAAIAGVLAMYALWYHQTKSYNA